MLAILAGIGFFLIRFQVLIAPLIMALILAYLLNPVVVALTRIPRVSRTLAVLLVYGVMVLILAALLGGAGLIIRQQLSGVLNTMLNFVNAIPGWFDTISARPAEIGPFIVDLSSVDATLMQSTLLPTARDWIIRVTEWMTEAASGVATFIGWMGFVIIVSYYLIHDVVTLETNLLRLVPDEYRKDAERLLAELGPIWNAFLRGQLLLGLIMGSAVGIVMSLLGVHYSLILGMMAAVMEFVPVVGPYLTAGTAIVIALFQPANWLGLPPITYTILVAAAALALQQIEANFLNPRVMGSRLRVHPAILIVGALVGFTLLGIPGLLLSGPIIATGRLFGRYVYAKLLNLPAWAGGEGNIASGSDAARARIRPARKSDRKDMAELTAQIWEGTDYVPRVWADWLADPEGILAAAEAKGRMVGFGKLTRLNPREWWLEGLRVHPEYRGLKIGSQLTEYLVGEWKRRGGGTLRLATSSERLPVHHLSARLGFHRIGVYRIVAAPAADDGAAYRPILDADTGAVLSLWAKHNRRGMTGLVNDGWKWCNLTEDRLAGFVRRRRAWWWGKDEGVLLAFDSDHENRPALEAAAIIAPAVKYAPMLNQLRALAGKLKFEWAVWVAPDTSSVVKAASRAGFDTVWDARLWIFERSQPPANTSSTQTEA